MSDEDTRPVGVARPPEPLHPLDAEERISLVEMVNRVLDKGVVVTGEAVIGVGGVDLVYLGLQLVLSSVDTLDRMDHVRPLRPPPQPPQPSPQSSPEE